MNKFFILIKTALSSLAVNKLRTFLTILGIVIGILSVITLLNLGQAAQASIQESVSGFGSNLISVIPGKLRTSTGFNFSMSESFTMEQVDAFKDAPKFFISGVATSASQVTQAQYGSNNLSLSTIGVYGDYWDVQNIKLAQGKAISEKQIQSLEKVAVVGPDLTSKLFDDENPIGKKIKLNNQTFTVIGVTVARGSNGFTNPDTNIYIPLSALQRYLSGRQTVTSLLVLSKDPNQMAPAADEIETILRRVQKTPAGEENNFTIRNSQQALSILDQITSILTAFLAAIGAISLLVGGIGIMNIMFVTVNERTKEIGLRKSLGATKNDILLQFLAEAIVVTLLGGILGTALGLGLTYLIANLAALPFTVDWSSVLLAVGVSGTIGLVFGIYPAWKAAQLSPIDALRYE